MSYQVGWLAGFQMSMRGELLLIRLFFLPFSVFMSTQEIATLHNLYR